jgi:hypothetical protein
MNVEERLVADLLRACAVVAEKVQALPTASTR